MQKIPYETDQHNPAIRAYVDSIVNGKKSQHILPINGKWVVKRIDSDKANKIFITQEEAIKFASSNATVGTAVLSTEQMD